MNNKLYYVGYDSDHNINCLDLSSFTSKTYIEGNFGYPIFFGDYIYYMDQTNDYSINRMNLDGSDRTVLVTTVHPPIISLTRANTSTIR